LTLRIHELAKRHPRYGDRRIRALLVREGWRVNRKRVHRIWRLEGLRIPPAQKKRRRLGSSENSCVRRCPEHVHHVWSYDFVFDQTEDGRQLKWLSVLEEFSRFNLALEVQRHFTGKDVVVILHGLFEEHGAPDFIRSDNGPECIAEAVRAWLSDRGVKTAFIDPGAPWENGYTESFNGSLRDELLDREIFGGLLEAKVLAREYRAAYNYCRPHSSLGYQTPGQFLAERLKERSRGRGKEFNFVGSPRTGDPVLVRGRSTPQFVVSRLS
jgi:transposase InsO family protein